MSKERAHPNSFQIVVIVAVKPVTAQADIFQVLKYFLFLFQNSSFRVKYCTFHYTVLVTIYFANGRLHRHFLVCETGVALFMLNVSFIKHRNISAKDICTST